MSRRKKKILISSILLSLAFLATVWFLWGSSENKRYIPGEKVEGLTARLERQVPKDYHPVTFRDVSREAGINFSHFNQERTSQLPEDMGSGAAWLDYNNDGWDDLFIVNYAATLDKKITAEVSTAQRCALFKNMGDGTFQRAGTKAGADLAIRGMGVAAGDYDGDGLEDLFITAFGTNKLLKNQGDGTFADVSESSGLNSPEGYWAGASWADYDRDGDLDLYVTGYVQYVDFNLPHKQLAAEEPPSINPSSFKAERNLLYRNNGDGTFTERGREAGVENTTGRSLSASWVDVNNDHWPDLYVANDVSDNVLYINRRDGTFEDFSHSAHVADYRGAMGIGSGDWDNDGDLDLFITHWIAQENALYTNLWHDTLSINNSELRFRDDSAVHGLGQSSLDYVGWSTSFVDLDLDGKLDLYIVNGSTFQYPENPVALKPMQDQIYWNGGKQRGFFEVSSSSGPYFNSKFVGRGGAWSDYDHDGDIDLYIANHGGPGILLNNRQKLGNNWISVRLDRKHNSPPAVGARVRVVSGELRQIREVGSQSSYLSQNSRAQIFGLGRRTSVDTLEVTWPDGRQVIKTNLPVNRRYHISNDDPIR